MNKPKIRFNGYTDAWEQRKLGDYCDMFNGDRSSKYPNIQDMVSEGIPFINAGDLENGSVNLTSCNKITREKYEDLGGAKLQLGDIVYCLRGTLGKNAYIDNFTEGTVASSLVALRPKKIDGRYLFHVLNSDVEYRQRVVRDEGAAQPNLSAKSVSEYMIPIPDIDEQKKVSSYLDKLNSLITLHQRKCEETKMLKKFMLQKMFPKDGESVPEIRFSGFTDAWEQRKLGEITDRITRKNQDLVSTLPLTISAQYGLIDQNEFFDKRVASKDVSGYYLVNNGEFAYNKSTSSDAPWGAIKRLDRYENGVLSTLYIVFAIKDESQIDSDYLVSYYDTDLWHRGVREIAAEGARNHGLLNITPADFFETSLAVPQDIEEQKAIGKFFTELNALITLHQRKCEELQNIKKFMLQNMFAS